MLIKCPECGKEVSDKSKNCINCGYPIFDELKKIVLSSSELSKSSEVQNENIKAGLNHALPNDTAEKKEIQYKETVQNGRRFHYVNSLNERLCPYCHAQISSEFSSACSFCGKSIMVSGRDTHAYTPSAPPLILTKLERNENSERHEYYVRRPETDGKAIGSLVLGICAFLFGGIFFVGLLCAIIGYILGKDYKRGIGRIGKILCTVALVIFVIVGIVEICFLGSIVGFFGKFI